MSAIIGAVAAQVELAKSEQRSKSRIDELEASLADLRQLVQYIDERLITLERSAGDAGVGK